MMSKLQKIISYRPAKRSELQKLADDFFGNDDKRHFILGTMIVHSNRKQSQLLEDLLLKTYAVIKDEMLLSDFYCKRDLGEINFLLLLTRLKT